MQVSDSSRVLCAGSRKAPSSREGVSSSATTASPRHSGGAASPDHSTNIRQALSSFVSTVTAHACVCCDGVQGHVPGDVLALQSSCYTW
jgi:hypothetical protein